MPWINIDYWRLPCYYYKALYLCHNAYFKGLFLILPGLMSDAMPIMIGVLLYSLLLTTMLWRAIDRADLFSEEPFGWSKLSSCVGAMFFAVSDTILALNQFYMRIPYHQVSTYPSPQKHLQYVDFLSFKRVHI